MDNRKLNFCGDIYTVEKFAKEFAESNEETALIVIEKLIKQGRANWVDTSQTKKQDKALLKTLVQEAIQEQAEVYDNYDRQALEFKHQQQRANRLTYKGIELDFAHLGKAQEFELWIVQELNLETEVAMKNGHAVLRVFNLTDKDMNAINLRYKADKGIQTVVGSVDTVAKNATKAVDYTATKVLAPTVQVGARAGVSILKTLAVTGAKTTGTLISALTNGTKQCVQEVRTDADVVRATRDILDAKDSTMRMIRNHTGSAASGVRIID